MIRNLKIIISVVLVVSMIALGVGCTNTTPAGSSAVSSNTSSGNASSEAEELSGTLDLFLAVDLAPEAAVKVVEMFQEDYPGVTLDVETCSYTDLNERLLPRVTANDAPDVFSIGGDNWSRALVEKGGFLRDISHTRAWQNLSQAAKDAFTHNGVAYGIPQAKNTVFCYYNIGYFEAAGITELPTNFDEFIEVCEKLKAAGYRPFGIAGAGPNNMAHSLVSQGILYQIIESGYDPDWVEKANAGEYDYDTRQWRHLLDKAVILRDGDYFQPGFKSADYTEAVRVMAMGEVAMTFHQNILYMQLVPEAKKNGFDIGIMPIPWNDPGQQQCGQWSFEGGPALGDNDNGMEKVADVFFDYIAYDKYYLFQNQTAATSPFETDPPDLIVDEFLAKNVEIINGLSVTGGYAALVFPAPVYSQVKNFIQEVIFGTAAPEDIGEFLNPAQQEYADSIK